MSGEFIYLIWDHDEYGPENIAATMRVERLPDLIREYYGGHIEAAVRGGCDARHIQRLEDEMSGDLAALPVVIERADENGVAAFGSGWGGLHLQKVELR